MEMQKLSPLRNTTKANNAKDLATEQLHHFGINPATPFGHSLQRVCEQLYICASDINQLWATTIQAAQTIDRADRIAYFNALKFLSFQLAKLLDLAQAPARKSYQMLDYGSGTQCAKGPYPVFDNVTAIFSANPVIARTATYIYACAEWIADAFEGKELLLEIYSRLLNPTAVALANHVVDLEAGPYAGEYFAWNFNSGMAAIDTVLAHVLGRDDIVISSRNIYGGAHQLIHDWYAKPSNLDIHVHTFDGYGTEDFLKGWERVKKEQKARLDAGRKVYVYLESPCNPHGYVLDVPGICREAHKLGMRVILDATVSTPFLIRPLQRENPAERPDFIIHSYTKDLSGTGSVIAGVVIGRNEDMFIPKGDSAGGVAWNETMFWNVYYVKGAFLNADAAFEVLQGIRTLEVRMLTKCINTLILARFLGAHPSIRVHCNALAGNDNYELGQKLLHMGLPAPLFTIHFDAANIPHTTFKRFFDNLSPTFGHMISLGQSNTIVACPGLTTHSELSPDAQKEAGISPTTIRFAVGDENPKDLLAHLIHAARLSIDPDVPGFSAGFPTAGQADTLVKESYMEVHRKYIDSRQKLDY